MGKRFAIVIGVAAAGVMALGAQTVLAGGQPVDSVPPAQLSGPKKQKLDNAVKVKASCGDEACNVLTRGGLTNVTEPGIRDQGRVRVGLKEASAHLAPGETATLKLKLPKGEDP